MTDDFELNLRLLAFWDQWLWSRYPKDGIYILDKRTLRIYGSYDNLIDALRKNSKVVEYWKRNLIRCPRVPYLKAVELHFEEIEDDKLKEQLKQNPNKIILKGSIILEKVDLPETEQQSLTGIFHFVWDERKREWILEDIKFENSDDYEYVK